MNEAIIRATQKTFIALKDPYGSVEKVYPNIIDAYRKTEAVYYMGVKNCVQIPTAFIESVSSHGFYVHTLDKSSVSGRAIDVFLQNPYTGRPMTGSSSGTAINVLLGINDIGIGSDGGGSVLAPAMAVNLFGFISPLLGRTYMPKETTRVSISTDGIAFKPSLGCMSKRFEVIEQFLTVSMPELEKAATGSCLRIIADAADELELPDYDWQHTDLSFRTEAREVVLKRLPKLLCNCDVLVSKEGPIDFVGLGDTVLDIMMSRRKECKHAEIRGLSVL